MSNRSRTLALTVLFFALVIFALPAWVILQSGNGAGHPATDWDLHILYAWVPKITLLEYGEWPLWNPYHCGGMSLIGNPQSRFLSPWFIFHLLFKTEFALKLEAVTHLLIAGLSSYYLCLSLKMDRLSAKVGACVYALNGAMFLRISGAHFTFLSFSYAPLFFLFLYRSMHDPRARWIIFGSIVLTFIGLDGLTYPLVLTLLSSLFWVVGIGLFEKNIRALISWMGMIGLSSLFLAPKILPVVETITAFDRSNSSKDALPFSMFYHAFLSREQHFSITFPKDQWLSWGLTSSWWGEYGAYMGWGTLILVALGIYNMNRLPKGRSFLFAMFSLLILWFGNFSELAPWALLRNIPPFHTHEFSSRMSHPLMLYFSIFSAVGMQIFLHWTRSHRSLQRWMGAIPLILAADLCYVGLQPIQEMVFHDNGNRIANKPFYQIRSTRGLSVQAANYNLGVVNCYESLFPSGPKTSVTGLNEKGYHGEFWSENPVHQSNWSPNHLQFNIEPKATPLRIIVNQNFDPGWVSVGGSPQQWEGLLSVTTATGSSHAELRFRPKSWHVGLFLLALALVVILVFKRSEKFIHVAIGCGILGAIVCLTFVSKRPFFDPNRTIKDQDRAPSILYATLGAMEHAQSHSIKSEQFFSEVLAWPGSDPTTLNEIWKNVHASLSEKKFP